MKAIGMVKKVDELGRILLPIELRKAFGIEERNTMLEIFTEDDCIILKKYTPACIFCGETRNMISFEGKNICQECAKKLGAIAK